MSDSIDFPSETETPRSRPTAEIVVALVMTVLSFVWFLSRLSPDIAFGAWQGPLLSHAPLHRVPLLSHWLAQALAAIPFGDPALRLNILTAAFGALTCGALAATGTRLGRALAGPPEAAACGIAGAAMLACTAPLT
ncbi:MAG: hypothetical protein RBU21_24860, partial [FCB group bacterium]|nr:hypothetical protein [FCB group bacterium]